MWFVFALLSAVFAALTSILAKVGIEGVNSNLATAIRTMVVLAMAWGMVFVTNTQGGLTDISRKSWLFLTSRVWRQALVLCYYRALQIGEASKVVPIDKAQRGHHARAGVRVPARALHAQVPDRLSAHRRGDTADGFVISDKNGRRPRNAPQAGVFLFWALMWSRRSCA